MAVTKVQSRGQITLPRSVRQRAGVQPGDTVTLTVAGPGKVELNVLPRLSLAETFERWRIEGPINWADDREQWEAEAAEEVIRKAQKAAKKLHG